MKITHTDDFEFRSWGTELNYALRHIPSQKEVFLFGYDAVIFDAERSGIEFCYPDMTTNKVFERLWTFNEYEHEAESFGVSE